jgi:uncharacterized protein YjbI with pentapeptide repeats
MRVAPSLSPRISKHLEPWSGTLDSEVDIQDVSMNGCELVTAYAVHIDGVRIDHCSFAGTQLTKLELTDTIGRQLESAAIRPHKASFIRVEITDSRYTGSDFPDAHFEDCVFKGTKFDEVGFRFATFKRVSFINCILRNADFSGASFTQVTFSDCDVRSTNFSSANCKGVDMTGQNLFDAKGLLGLKGATISSLQLVQMAPLLADELGFYVQD